MAGKRKTDGKGDASGPRVPPLPRDRGRDRQHDRPDQVRDGVRRGDEVPDGPRASDRPREERDADTQGRDAVVVGRRGDSVNLFLPQDGQDLSIYKQMLQRGAIRPYEMPNGIERLAERVEKLMQIAEESGRSRDAMKAAEILRHLMNDNRAIAVEFDKIQRLDAGKPTSISGQIDPERAARIKRIVSTQRPRTNTETTDGGSGDARGSRGGGGDAGARDDVAAQAGGGSDPAGRADAAAEAPRAAGAEDPAPREEDARWKS